MNTVSSWPSRKKRPKRRRWGHERRIEALTPRLRYVVSCKCGWAACTTARYLAEQAYSDHLLSIPWSCRACGETDESKRARAVGVGYRCRACLTAAVREWAAEHPEEFEERKRSSHLRKSFGITSEQYEKILAKQGGGCAICGATTDDIGHPTQRHLHVDHDHETGLVRGILCFNCNRGLGSFHEDVFVLANALDYLQSATQEKVAA